MIMKVIGTAGLVASVGFGAMLLVFAGVALKEAERTTRLADRDAALWLMLCGGGLAAVSLVLTAVVY